MTNQRDRQHQRELSFVEAHEQRIGKRREDWTADDTAGFVRHVAGLGSGPREDFTAGIHALPAAETPAGSFPVTHESLIALADRCLDAFATIRRRDAERALPVIASVLLTTGGTVSVESGSENRLATLRMLAKTRPVYGYFLVFDGWVHRVEQGITTSVDVLIAHLGTRDLRLLRMRPYRIKAGLAVFDDTAPLDIAPADLDSDPYASIFVTVPPPTGQPS